MWTYGLICILEDQLEFPNRCTYLRTNWNENMDLFAYLRTNWNSLTGAHGDLDQMLTYIIHKLQRQATLVVWGP